MSRHDPDRYVTRLVRSQYSILRGLVTSGHVRRASVRMPGWGAATAYECLAPVSARGDHLLRVGPVDLTAQLYALPSEAYRALLRGSEDYWQPDGLADLHAAFGAPGADAAAFIAALRSVLARPFVRDRVPHLASRGVGEPVTWDPAGTVLLEQAGDWFVALAFWAHRRVVQGGDVVFGIDLNADPALCIAETTGAARMIGPRHELLGALRRGRGGPLTQAEVRVVRALGYASGREPLEAALSDLLVRAAAVGVERLDPRRLYAGFVERSREQAALDWHVSWLPQALYRARIRLYRVDPAFTTRTCHRHPTRLGVVRGRVFECPLCGDAQHRDVNAARNILARTLAAHRDTTGTRRGA